MCRRLTYNTMVVEACRKVHAFEVNWVHAGNKQITGKLFHLCATVPQRNAMSTLGKQRNIYISTFFSIFLHFIAALWSISPFHSYACYISFVRIECEIRNLIILAQKPKIKWTCHPDDAQLRQAMQLTLAECALVCVCVCESMKSFRIVHRQPLASDIETIRNWLYAANVIKMSKLYAEWRSSCILHTLHAIEALQSTSKTFHPVLL